MEASASIYSSPLHRSTSSYLQSRSRLLPFTTASLTGFKRRWFSQSNSRRNFNTISYSSQPSPEASPPIAPLQMESPVGQFLSEILLSHPHLVPAAVDQQLHLLKTAREADRASEDDSSSSGTELVLYRRIAEVRANERAMALEEMMYALVVQKFVESDVALILGITQPSDPSDRVDRWSPQEEKVEQLHSPEAYEMIKNHLSLILGQRLGDSNSVAPISKLRVGQVYAASIMYGYFLKRVDRRFQLEKSMKMLPWGSDEEENAIKKAMPDESRPSYQGENSISKMSPLRFHGSNLNGSGGRGKSSRLRSYVMSFDSEALQRYATIRSKEAFNIIEKQTEALFGRGEIVITRQGAIEDSKGEVIKISLGGLRGLILEAVTFGSFLWDVESHVDSRYHFVTN